MNILYVSHLTNNPWAGPSYSVPAQIEAQSKIDNVFWYNISNTEKAKEWKSISYYHDNEEFPEQRIGLLPKPFNNPDIVVVEQFYNMAKCPILRELMYGKIPYIIVPRGELTIDAQNRKRLKKFFANNLCFKKFARNAAAIHFLTEQERISSGNKWNAKSYVIPNGIAHISNGSKLFSESVIKCVSIGRIEPYQKGLDLLVEACARIKDRLLEANVKIELYGPDVDGKSVELEKIIHENDLDDILSIHGPVFNEEKKNVLEKSDVFLMPSRFEGHPMALIEALSYGLPCVVTPGSNMQREVEQFSCGWCSEFKLDALAGVLCEVVKKRDCFGKFSENAKKLASGYCWEKIAEKERFIFENIVKFNDVVSL